mmetsp:Transcript_15084/g.21286  ORF Transcript_15084/g.21286 Transcript_15084/m.21286 type:complete len:97 (+) Transcript_15084:232-522(+)
MLPSSATITVSDDEELDAPPPYAAFQQQGQTANSAHHSRQNGRPRISDGPSSIGLGYSGFRPNAQSATLTAATLNFQQLHSDSELKQEAIVISDDD